MKCYKLRDDIINISHHWIRACRKLHEAQRIEFAVLVDRKIRVRLVSCHSYRMSLCNPYIHDLQRRHLIWFFTEVFLLAVFSKRDKMGKIEDLHSPCTSWPPITWLPLDCPCPDDDDEDEPEESDADAPDIPLDEPAESPEIVFVIPPNEPPRECPSDLMNASIWQQLKINYSTMNFSRLLTHDLLVLALQDERLR